MILSNVEIQKALDDGRLMIKPEPLPRLPQLDEAMGEVKCAYDTTSVDLTLGDEIAVLEPQGSPMSIDFRHGKFAPLSDRFSKSFKITPEQPFSLERGRFVLGKTHEWVDLPIVKDGRTCLMARVEGKSSFARCGMLVHFTAPTIHAGYGGTITLEIIHHGPFPILLYPRMRICQLVVEEVAGVPFEKKSQFHEQTRPGGQKG